MGWRPEEGLSAAVGGANPSLALGAEGEAGCGLAGKSKDSSAEKDDSQPGLPLKSREARMNQPLQVERSGCGKRDLGSGSKAALSLTHLKQGREGGLCSGMSWV